MASAQLAAQLPPHIFTLIHNLLFIVKQQEKTDWKFRQNTIMIFLKIDKLGYKD